MSFNDVLTEQELIDILNNALTSSPPITEEDAERIFENAEKHHNEFQKRLDATVPTWKDKLRIYNI